KFPMRCRRAKTVCAAAGFNGDWRRKPLQTTVRIFTPVFHSRWPTTLNRKGPQLMPHIHEKIDFTVAIFVVHNEKILLIHHRQLDKWLPLGGHIELDEDPEQVALCEAKEESGLEVELLGERPPTTSPGTRALITPGFLDIHRITNKHEHIGMIYWARP